ncbi:polyamine-modulated factor 1-binding protein 1 isoform X1 [Prunus persica]|uniref:polyamine-modulated factor 1-binding protein 1 isoform X1 n=1 Tax=Prunus persica TaxID=3760 RepID=UPI0009ABA597|nr:polyamine-modulated factor 1-binding protein 1 isoform X1 [Prunus persica]
MAGSDPRKHLFNLIHDFASEKSHGERRVVGLRKRIEELRSELEVANAELEEAKRSKETIEQDLKGYEVELHMNEATIQTLESRISLTQDEISTVGSDLDALKNKKGASRDEFISQMFEINTQIRKFQESIARKIDKLLYNGSTEEEDPKLVKEEVTEGALSTLEDMLAGVISQTTEVEEEFKSEQNIEKQVQQALIDCERKVFLMEEMLEATKALQDLTRQTSELEQICATVGEKLQRRCICPSCHLDNVGVLGGLMESSEAN